MAAVRCRSYRNKEFSDRKSDLGISVRKDYHYVRYYDRISQREIPDSKERDGYNHSPRISNSSSGASGNDPKRRRVRLVDHDVDVGAQVSQKLEDGGLHYSSKKRKFSPIHDTKVHNFISPRIRNGIQEPFAVQPPQPLPHENTPPHSIKKTRQSEDCRLASDLKGLVDSPLDQGRSSEREPGEIEVEEDDNNLIRNITTSRWASCDDEEVVLKSSSSTPSSHLTDMKDACECTTSSLFDSDREHGDVGLAGDDDYTLDTDSEAEDNELELPQRRINMLQGCRNVDEFEKVDKINEGTYGVVYRAREKKTGEIVALKKVKMEREREGFPLTSLREINILLSLQHSSIVSVNEVVVGLDSVFMVMEYMEHDLKGLMDTMKQPFSQSEVKCLMLQLLEGIDYLHNNWVLHRDLKTANLLMNNRGELKICDFGLSRRYSSPLRPYTQLVVSLWYRAPELLLGTKVYSTAIDMWSLGCIMAELLAKKPLFKGHNEIDQLKKIFEILGTPNELIWPGYSKLPGVKVNFVEQPHNKLRGKFPAITSYSGLPALSEAGFDLLNKLLMYDPKKRMTAKMALKHAWFHEVPLPKTKEFMPTFPSQIAQDRSLRRSMKSLDPVVKNCNKEAWHRQPLWLSELKLCAYPCRHSIFLQDSHWRTPLRSQDILMGLSGHNILLFPGTCLLDCKFKTTVSSEEEIEGPSLRNMENSVGNFHALE